MGKNNKNTKREYDYLYFQRNKEARLEYRRRYRQEHIEQERETERQRRLTIKMQVLSHYSNGNPRCISCGVNDTDVLTIDHINGGGCQHRRAIGYGEGGNFYNWLKKMNYPQGYQVLCCNCNIKKARATSSVLCRFWIRKGKCRTP